MGFAYSQSIFEEPDQVKVFYYVVCGLGLLSVIGFMTGYCCDKRSGKWLFFLAGLSRYCFTFVMYIIFMCRGMVLPGYEDTWSRGEMLTAYLSNITISLVLNGWFLTIIGSWANLKFDDSDFFSAEAQDNSPFIGSDSITRGDSGIN